MPMDGDTKLQRINGVEVFSVGTWNGDTYTQADLEEMVKAFNATAKTLRPPLKLGHDDKQKLLQKDGMPAAGWIDKLYIKGGKLVADFVDIPSKIYQLIKNKAYRNVSSEIYWDIQLEGKKFKRMLSAVALLGADMPAVSNLKDIMAMYGMDWFQEIKSYTGQQSDLIIKEYNLKGNDELILGGVITMDKTETELKLENDLKAEQDKVKNYSKSLEDKEKEIEAAKTAALEAQEQLKKYQKELTETQLEKSLDELQNEKLISPSMRAYVKALLEEGDKKEYSLKVQEEEKKFSKASLVKEILKLHSAIGTVNTTESSVANKVENEGGSEQAQHDKIQEYMKEHKVSYSAAYKAVVKVAQA
jgi:hypothetical protein